MSTFKIFPLKRKPEELQSAQQDYKPCLYYTNDQVTTMETGSQEFIQMVVGDLEDHFADNPNQMMSMAGSHGVHGNILTSGHRTRRHRSRALTFSQGPNNVIMEDDDKDSDDDNDGSVVTDYNQQSDDMVHNNSQVVLGQNRLLIPGGGMIMQSNQNLGAVEPGYIAMKPGVPNSTVGLSDIHVYGQNSMGHIILQEGVESEMIVEENVEVGEEVHGDNGTPHGEIILVPNSMLKQELLEGEEVIVGSNMHPQNVGNEIVIGEHLSSVHGGRHPDISLADMDDTFDSNLIIDTSAIKEEGVGPSVGYDCGECGAVMKSRGALRKHITKYHAPPEPEPLDMPNKIYNCPSCTYQTGRRDKLDKHMSKHVADGYSPSGKKRNKMTPPQRMRRAAEEYKCPLCPYRCTVEKAYKKHLKLHQSGTKHFVVKVSCKICGKDRSSEADLRKHMRKHKDDKDFVCDICGFASIQLKKIIQHRRMHTGEKPHLCPHCAYRSARRDNLRSHVRRMHKKENMYIDTFNPRSEANNSNSNANE